MLGCGQKRGLWEESRRIGIGGVVFDQGRWEALE